MEIASKQRQLTPRIISSAAVHFAIYVLTCTAAGCGLILSIVAVIMAIAQHLFGHAAIMSSSAGERRWKA